MRLAEKSSVHNCRGNILSSVLDIRQLTNIKQNGDFCLEILLCLIGPKTLYSPRDRLALPAAEEKDHIDDGEDGYEDFQDE
jgi:hypothetical protein